MSKTSMMLEKAKAFDTVHVIRTEADHSLTALKEFRNKYRFAENLREIEWLDPDKLFKVNPDEVGDFFRFLETFMKPQGAAMGSSNVYRNARLQIAEFKKLLRIVVDDRKSLAEKIDAPWERIGGLGQDKSIPLKIIFCFNYGNGGVLPIFSIAHLRHFASRVGGVSSGQTKYFSPGKEYAFYIEELLNAKNSEQPTKAWDTLYFTRFLYQTYPPPDSEPVGVNVLGQRRVGMVETNEQLDLQAFMKLLGELQKQHKINGEQFRENRELWSKQPIEREALMQRLKKLLTPT
jgi:hypothetical protein